MISEALAVLETEEQRNELADFYEKNKSRFYTIAFDHLHNQEEAEDAIQEAFLEIANKPDTFFGDCFVYKPCGFNKCRNNVSAR